MTKPPIPLSYFSLKTLFGIHFFLITGAVQGIWTTNSYAFYNTIFLVALLLGIRTKEREEPIQIAIMVNEVSIVLDIITFLFYGKMAYFFVTQSYAVLFSMSMAILNLAFRPVSVIFMSKISAERLSKRRSLLPSTSKDITDPNPINEPSQNDSLEDAVDISTTTS